MQKQVQAFSSFIEKERSTSENIDSNLLAFSLGSLKRKYQKIWMLREYASPLIENHGQLIAEQLTWKSGSLSEEQQNQIECISKITIEIEMYFESFFMYGTILCDEIAQLFLYLFGPVRGVKLGSHRELAKNFLSYSQKLSIEHDKDLPTLATFLENELCDYRDKQIVHDFHPRKIDAVSFNNGTRDVQICYGMLYPKETDKYVISKSWGELLHELDRYVWLVLEVVHNNRGISRFPLSRVINNA
jgi:hypothetical protein